MENENENRRLLSQENKSFQYNSINIGSRLEAFKNDEKIKMHFEEFLPRKYTENYTEAFSILSIRNVCVILSILEIFSAFWGFSFYFIRRSLIYIIVNAAAFILSLIGIYSIINMNEVGLILYTLFTTSVPGTFFLFQVFEYFVLDHNSNIGENYKLNDHAIMLIFIVPYVFDFIAGVFTMIMMYRIAIFNDLLKEKSNWANRENMEEARRIADGLNEDSIKREANERLNKNKDMCFICQKNPKDCIFEPCNHVNICFQCFRNHELFLVNCGFCYRCKSKIKKGLQIYRA